MPMKSKRYTRESILRAIRFAVKKLGHLPLAREFKALTGISAGAFLRHFVSFRAALRAAGFRPGRGNARISDAALMNEWGGLVRRLQRIPPGKEFDRRSKFCADVLVKRFGPWSTLPALFLRFSEHRPEWADVRQIINNLSHPIRRGPRPQGRVRSLCFAPPVHSNSPRLLAFRGFLCEPANEDGVLLLFGAVALELGFLIQSVQSAFPDCLALHRTSSGKWQLVRIEFEFESRNFLAAGHRTDGCDLIVCWRHTWPACPLPVLELSKEIRALPAAPAVA